jgi:hypothetical protein
MRTARGSRPRTRTVQSRFFLGLFMVGLSWPSTTALSSSKPQSLPDPKEKPTFQLKLISDGILCPIDDRDCEDRDIKWKDFALSASDGHMLHLTSIPFPSVERSKKHFRTSIKGAEKVLRDEPELDSKGEIIGERALGLFSPPKDAKPRSSVPKYRLFWMWGENYFELTGEHLDDVLKLESKLKEEGIRAIWTWH